MPSSSPLRPIPDVTPMLGVLAVLLIVILVIRPMMYGCEPDPPKVDHLPSQLGHSGDTLIIDRDGNYYLNKKRMPSRALESALNRWSRASRGDRILYIFAARFLEYAYVQRALDAARESGVGVVGLIVDPNPTGANLGYR